MAFPTTSVLDTFPGANADPIGAPWANPVFSGDATLRVAANQLAKSVGGAFGSAYYNTGGPYGPDVEIWVTVATPEGTNAIELAGRIQSIGTIGVDCYFLHVTSSGSFQCWQVNDSAQAQLGSSVASSALAAGDQIGVEITGASTTTVKGFRRTPPGAWTEIISRDDTVGAITAAGHIGVVIENTLIRLDDFAGGTVVTAPWPPGGSDNATEKLRVVQSNLTVR